MRVLGPVEIREDGAWQRPPGPQSRLLLALLALSAGQVLSVGDLVDGLWGQRPPPSARASLQILVTRLRKALAGVPGCTVERYGDGYRLRISPSLVDVHRFRSLVRSARQCADAEDAVAVLGQALALWRGLALADVPATQRIEVFRHGLAQEYLSAAQERFSHMLATGRESEAVAEIPLMLARHPLAERLAGMLMLACYRCGRQADALRVFRDLRARLADELGVDPDPEMQHLHQQILSADPALTPPDWGAGSRRGVGEAVSAPASRQDGLIFRARESRPGKAQELTAGWNGHGQPGAESAGSTVLNSTQAAALSGPDPDAVPGSVAREPGSADGRSRLADVQLARIVGVPRQLPVAPAGFAGRDHELGSLTRWLDDRAGPAESVIMTISGIPGVGKTALALHWAHQVQQRFPDGQLYVNLRGFDASPSPVGPAEAIASFLESLGVAAAQVPATLDACAGLYRSLLAGKRMLIMLDNARDEAQVRPLLPGSPACVALVTSRNDCAGLVAAEGARPLMLDVLTVPEAERLLVSRLGADRVAAEAGAAAELISLCSRLPLALAIAAARAATRPALPLAAVTSGLRDVSQRLDGLDAGDEATNISAVFSWSFRLLSEPAARMFPLLGTYPGPDIAAAAAAALAGIPAAPARSALSELARAGLVQEQVPGRFTLHDLLRAYAAELAGEGELRGSLHRVLDYYLRTAHMAVGLAYPSARQISITPPDEDMEPEPLAGSRQALAWLQAEHEVLLAAAGAAARGGFDTHAWQFPAVLREYFARRGHYLDWARLQRQALAAAARLGDDAALALAHQSLGDALIHLRSWTDAHYHLKEALHLDRELGDHVGQAGCHYGLGGLSEAQGDYDTALKHAQRALRMYQAAGDPVGQAAALNGIGWCFAQLGNNQRALGFCKKALGLHQVTGDRFGEAATLDSLGYCSHLAGRYSQAVVFYQQALGAYADAGDHTCHRAYTLIRLGETRRAAGDPRAAMDAWLQAAEIFNDLPQRSEAVRAKLRELAAATSGIASSGP